MLALASPLTGQTTSVSHRVYWSNGPVTPADSLAAMAAMQSSLRGLVVRMEAFFSDSGHYPSTLASLKAGGVPGVTLTLVAVKAEGWAATATHRALNGISCVIAVNEMGSDTELPTTLGQNLAPREDGAPLCDDPRAVPHQRKPATMVGKVLTSVANEDAVDIAPRKFAQYKFQVPVTPLNCKLQGRVRGLAGGNKDVNVYFLTDDQFVEYVQVPSGGGEDSAVHALQDVQLDYQIYGAGTYYLVVSNRFSTMTTKVVQVKADVRCTNTPRPHIVE